MDFKEKYQEALERAKKGLPLEEVFPELKESEEERIRKILIEQMERWHECALENNVVQDIKDSADAISYLEKQKEQKPVISDEAIREGVAHFGITQYQIDYWLKKHINVVEQQPSEWSEEDEERIKSIKATLEQFAYSNGMLDVNGDYCDASIIKNMNWLKDLHTKVHMQPKQEWSEEDNKKIGRLRSVVNECAFRNDALDVNGDYCEGDYGELDNWLTSFPERFNLQSKQEWSKKEKGILLECVTALQNSSHWLLADKLSSLRPRPSWKPSEEQIEALARDTDRCVGVDDAKILVKLLERLEKL